MNNHKNVKKSDDCQKGGEGTPPGAGGTSQPSSADLHTDNLKGVGKWQDQGKWLLWPVPAQDLNS